MYKIVVFPALLSPTIIICVATIHGNQLSSAACVSVAAAVTPLFTEKPTTYLKIVFGREKTSPQF